MNRIPKSAVITGGIVLFLFALMGVTNSEHAIAKVVYGALIIASLAIIALGFSDRPRPHAAGQVTARTSDLCTRRRDRGAAPEPAQRGITLNSVLRYLLESTMKW